MPTANDTWVRSVGLSKITATVRGPASGRAANRSAFSSRGEVEHLGLLGRAEVVVAQEVPGHAVRPASAAWPSSRIAGQAARNVVGLLGGEDQRRGQPDRVGRAGVDDEAGRSAAAATCGGDRRVELEPEQQPARRAPR